VSAVIAESYERIHRSNLVGMGVLPLQFRTGQNAESLGLTGQEELQIAGLSGEIRPRQDLTVEVRRAGAAPSSFTVTTRLDTPVEINVVAFRDLSRRKPIVPAGYPANSSAAAGVMAGDRLYLSGSFGADLGTGNVPPDPAAQVQLALDNMKRTLDAAGMDFRHVVFVNPYLTDQASGQMNAIYAKQFEFGNTPARATIRVASLPGGNTIEFTGVAVADLSKRVAVRPKNMRPSATASPCVFAGDTYYCSAKGPFTPGPDKVQGIYAATVEAQVRQTMRNLLDGLEEAGLTLANVVATNVYLDDIEDFPKMNRVYAQYFPELFPTRTTIATLPPIDRKAVNEDVYPGLEQISLVAVK